MSCEGMDRSAMKCTVHCTMHQNQVVCISLCKAFCGNGSLSTESAMMRDILGLSVQYLMD